MADDKKISELTTSGALDGTELVAVVQDGVTLKTTSQGIADLAAGGIPIPSNNSGDNVSITTGNNGAGNSGSIGLTTGTASGTRGSITLDAKSVSLQPDSGGQINLLGNVVTKDGVNFQLTSPNSAAGPTKQVFIASGDVTNTSVAGAGIALGGGTSSHGGDVSITAGGGYGSGITGGDVNISPGPNGSGGAVGVVYVGGPLVAALPTTAYSLQSGQMTITLTSDTNLRFSVSGSDNVTRVVNLTLA